MKSRSFAVLAAAAMLAGMWSADPSVRAGNADAVSAVIGDANADGVVDLTDVQVLREYLCVQTRSVSLNGDMDGDGSISAVDLTLLKRLLWLSQSLCINEVCASNQTSCYDAAGNAPDWIELYNAADQAIDLSGMGLSDGAKNKFKFTFPQGSTISAGGYLLVYCDDAAYEAEGEYHAAFKISADGETICLTHPMLGEIDALTVPALDTDVSYGCCPDGAEQLSLLTCTPNAANYAAKDPIGADAPLFSAEGGFYDAAFLLTLSDAKGSEILYTTDGSDPRTSATAKQYREGISIYNNTNDANVYSAITDITLNNYSVPNYKVDKGMVIRAVCKADDGTYSKVVTHSYFIGKTAGYYSDFKVVSLATDSGNLFDPDTGIYMVGSHYRELVASGQFTPPADKNDVSHPTNYNQSGAEYEIPMNVQVFENGTLAYTADVGARISGNWSRGYAQKSIRLYARSEYGDSKMKYEFIEGLTDVNGNAISSYDKITLRNGGTDHNLLHFRDMFIQQLCKDRAVDIQGGEPCMVFIDGEFWGFYFIREKLDADYVESHYDIPKENVTVLKNGELEDGVQSAADAYEAFAAWAATADMTVAANYQRVCDTMDLQSFMDVVTIETYINNADWATDYMNNWMMWRAHETDAANPYADGKWRFMLYDLDFTADYFDDGRTFAGFDSLNNLYREDAPYNFVPMFYNLLNNETFRAAFYDTYIDIMKNNFDPVDVSEALDAYVAKYRSAVYATNDRFDQAWVNRQYDQETEQFRQYFIDRRNAAKLYLDQLFGVEFPMTEGPNLVSNASTWSSYGSSTVEKSAADNTFIITAHNDAANSWDIQSQSGAFTVQKGRTYRVSFEAACTTGSPISLNINHNVGTSWPNCFSKSNIALTSELQQFTYTFVSSSDTASDWRLCFNFGDGAGVYTIKNATVTAVSYETELVSGLGSWHFYNPADAGTMTINGTDSVTVQTNALPDSPWEVQALYSGMVLEAGKTYTYSFTVQGDVQTTISAHVQQNYGDYTVYSQESAAVQTTARQYSYTFTAGSDCMDASVCFDCGNGVGTVTISDVSVICAN